MELKEEEVLSLMRRGLRFLLDSLEKGNLPNAAVHSPTRDVLNKVSQPAAPISGR